MGYVLSAACGCDVGRVRRKNEDNFCFDGNILSEQNNGTEGILTYYRDISQTTASFGVFDGMGGHADGQTASYMAASVFSDAISVDRTDHEQMLRETVLHMSDSVWKKASQEYNNMGTTAAMVRFDGNECYLANVGDSRIFLFRNGELRQISLDHTEEEFMKKMGITDRKPRLTQYVGMPADEVVVNPYLFKTQIADGDMFLLCSDGLTDMVSENDIAAVLSAQADVADKVSELIRQALENGGKDNTTVILIQVSGGDQSVAFSGGTGDEQVSNSSSTGLKIVLIVALAVLLCAVGVVFYVLRAGKSDQENAGTSGTATTQEKDEKEEDPDEESGGNRIKELKPDYSDTDPAGTRGIETQPDGTDTENEEIPADTESEESTDVETQTENTDTETEGNVSIDTKPDYSDAESDGKGDAEEKPGQSGTESDGNSGAKDQPAQSGTESDGNAGNETGRRNPPGRNR